jgi:hypothetical protein
MVTQCSRIVLGEIIPDFVDRARTGARCAGE